MIRGIQLEKLNKGKMLKCSLLLAELPRNRLDPIFYDTPKNRLTQRINRLRDCF